MHLLCDKPCVAKESVMARPKAYKGHNPLLATRAPRFLSTLLHMVSEADHGACTAEIVGSNPWGYRVLVAL